MVDPALSTLQHQFIQSVCTTVQGQYREGKNSCSWSSCREGCTHEEFTCWQIEVTYTVTTTNSSLPGKLYPNVKGCGYPPRIDCKAFAERFGQEGTNFTCFFSQKEPDLVITELDYEEVHLILLYSTALPLPLFFISILYLIFAYLYIYREDTQV